MKAIHKYQLDPAKKHHEFALKEGYKVVRAEYILAEKTVCVWIEVPLSVAIAAQTVHFRLVASGEPVPLDSQYVATAVDSFAPESYHLYLDSAESSSGLGEIGRIAAA